MAKSRIEWTEATWNPTTGCTKVSPGCKFCYAERMAKRLQGMGQPRYRNGFQLTLHERALELPLRWKKPQRIFVNSRTPFFFKQWGGRIRRRNGRMLQGRTWDEWPRGPGPRPAPPAVLLDNAQCTE